VTALDLFTGTTRVAQEFKKRGVLTTAVDTASYSEIFAQCYVATDATEVNLKTLRENLAHLSALPGDAGYVTDTFCVKSRFFQPFNGERIDTIRQAIEDDHKGTPLYPILLTSLIEAADRVDSTTGVQQAYIKQWSARSYNPLELRVPDLIDGRGHAFRGDACELITEIGEFGLAYLDPPYNQHRYFTNYHVWETLVRWDAPEHYGVACKRIDSREDETKSVFNTKAMMPDALRKTIREVKASVVILSYNDEAWISLEALCEMCSVHGHVEALAFDSKRYVGAQIGIYNPSGEIVGEISHLRNQEYVIVAGPEDRVRHMTGPYVGGSHGSPMPGQATLF
jgi:adenine-specific DNA-methyltransferase